MPNTNKISVTIITLNEERNIERCLRSVKWADEIVVLDSASKDRTVEICKKFGCRVINIEWQGFGATKKRAVNEATHDWILSIDADEEVTDELKNQVQNILKNPLHNGYKIKRNSFYLGKMIRHCGWNRDYPLKLFNRRFGNFNEKIVHESVKLIGDAAKIDAPLLHYTYPTVQSHIERMDNYSGLGASELFQKGKSSSILSAIFRGLVKFIKMYFIRLGFLDGKVGFVLCYNSAFGVYLKYIKLWEKNR